MKTYIALDLETTGFDAIKDQVIEIAAIKFQGDKIIESFHTLINPQVPIPAMVSHITGIKEEDLKEAALFNQVEEKLIQFLGNDPIIGHNIDFDINFLRAKGLNLKNPLYDTLALAGILLPGLPSYSLDTLGRLLKITHEQKHRAMSDTKACYELFLHLLQKISEIDPKLRYLIDLFLNKTNWPLKELFVLENPAKELPHSFEEFIQNLTNEKETNSISSKKADEEEKLYQSIMESLLQNKKILIETTAGLDIANLTLWAAQSWSNQSNQQGIVAINKTAFDKISELPPGVALINVPESYLSLQRFQEFIEKKNLADYEISLLIKVILWVKRTKTGNLKELSLQGKEATLLDEICCSPYFCDHKEKVCFFQRAKVAMKNAKVLAVSQNFFFHDRLSDKPLLPPSDYLILDQVDELEKSFTEALAVHVSFQNLSRPFEKIKNFLEDTNYQKLYKSAQGLVTRIEIIFGLIGIFIEKNSEPFQFCIYLKEPPFSSGNSDWQKVEEIGQKIMEAGHELLEELGKIDAGPKAKQLAHEGQKALTSLYGILLDSQQVSTLRWIGKGQDESIYLKKISTNSGYLLQNKILADQKSCVLLSESLTVEHSFDFIRKNLQLDGSFEMLTIKAENNLKTIKIFVVEDLPPPATEGSFLTCADVIKKIILKKRGKTVVLFTSKKAIAATYHAIAGHLKEQGITLLAQYVTGGRGKIMEYYKDEADTSALFATDYFWEKTELTDGKVDTLIIQKLPFDQPEDPFLVSKRSSYQDFFNDFQVPQTILKFKHQIGRLARATKTKGNIIILDSRIKQKSYGKKFLDSLSPEIEKEYIKKEKLLERLI